MYFLLQELTILLVQAGLSILSPSPWPCLANQRAAWTPAWWALSSALPPSKASWVSICPAHSCPSVHLWPCHPLSASVQAAYRMVAATGPFRGASAWGLVMEACTTLSTASGVCPAGKALMGQQLWTGTVDCPTASALRWGGSCLFFIFLSFPQWCSLCSKV